MDERDFEELRAIALSFGRLLGRLEEQQQSTPATPPVFLPPKTWHAAATDGKFTLYIKGGDCPAQMMPDAPATPTNGGDAMKYLTKRSDGR